MPARVDGIGGAFLFSKRPQRLATWYRRALDLPLRRLDDGTYYHVFASRSLARPRRKVYTVFAILPAEGRVGRSRNQAMVNYRVDDLTALVRALRRRGVRVDPIAEGPDGEGTGKFTHLRDPDGNRIELWEPSGGV